MLKQYIVTFTRILPITMYIIFNNRIKLIIQNTGSYNARKSI